MAHTFKTNTNGKFLTIEFDPTEAWIASAPMDILSICMRPAATADAVIVRDGNEGPEIFSHEAIDSYDHALRTYQKRETAYRGYVAQRGLWVTPSIAAAEATGNFIITFEVS